MRYLFILLIFMGCKEKPLVIKPTAIIYRDTQFIMNCQGRVLAMIPPGSYTISQLPGLMMKDSCLQMGSRQFLNEVSYHFKPQIDPFALDSGYKFIPYNPAKKAMRHIKIKIDTFVKHQFTSSLSYHLNKPVKYALADSTGDVATKDCDTCQWVILDTMRTAITGLKMLDYFTKKKR